MSGAWPDTAAGFRIEVHEVVGSTQDLARARLGRGEDVVVVGLEQTAGRGRLDRVWTSPPGNLYASTLLRVTLLPRLLPASSLVVAVALAEALEALGAAPRVKWPNDLLLGGLKVAGILLEHQNGHLVIGTGINVKATPQGQPAATTLAAVGISPTLPQLLEAYLLRLRARFTEFEQHGFFAIRQAWLERAEALGQPLRVRLADGLLEGRHGGIDDYGALRVEVADGVVLVAVGDVELVRTQEGA
ncbi:MAG: biotin--[acetyl-CoA-carboxylase] ligase [Geminicoccaceae bacterium]|nr:MAG: biotin--[acetyl-CoA-carboxylase] ligase [Geminicoccaceae bacterium]